MNCSGCGLVLYGCYIYGLYGLYLLDYDCNFFLVLSCRHGYDIYHFGNKWSDLLDNMNGHSSLHRQCDWVHDNSEYDSNHLYGGDDRFYSDGVVVKNDHGDSVCHYSCRGYCR